MIILIYDYIIYKDNRILHLDGKFFIDIIYILITINNIYIFVHIRLKQIKTIIISIFKIII